MGDSMNRRPLKIILVGSSGVGKTSLINSFFDQPYETDTQPTVAPAFCGTTVELADHSSVELHIWDTAGQERFQSIGVMFYRESDIAFVCFDIDNTETIGDWVERVKSKVPECLIFLVATKADMLSPEQRGTLDANGEKWKSDNGAKYFFITSASTGEGVHDLFVRAGECVNEILDFNHPEPSPYIKPAEKKRSKKDGCC